MTSGENGREQNAAAEPVAESSTFPVVRNRPELPNAHVAPQTTLQEVLLTVWAGILGIEKIGIEDDFFELGGDSILATQIISRLRQMFRMDLPPIILFVAPSIEQLADYMIAHETRPGLTEKTAIVLKRIEGMSEEEVARNLRSK